MTLKDELDQFCHEALDCYHHFRQSLVIFNQPQEKLDILNETAQHFFALLQNMFLDGIVMNMARLTDPPETFGEKNLSLRTLQKDLSQHPDCPTYVYPLLTEIHGIARATKVWRDKRGAHIGYEEALGLKAIPPLYIAQVQRFYDLLQEYINWVYQALFHTIYPIEAVDTKGADELLRALGYARALRQLRHSHIRLFDQIVKGKLPRAKGTIELLPFCPGCVPAINGMQEHDDAFAELDEVILCFSCKRHHCQNTACRTPLDATIAKVVPVLVYHMKGPLGCRECADREAARVS